LIIRTQSGFFTVETIAGKFVCTLRGKLKQGSRQGDLAAIGDRVSIQIVEPGRGVIEGIDVRQRYISRQAPLPKGEYEQIIIANPDQAVFVFACVHPRPKFRMLDRFLVSAEKQATPAVIVANKIDLVGLKQAQALFGHYEKLGYPLIYTSVKTGQGIDELHTNLRGKISAMAGPSGVGKSSLLNALHPGLGLAVKEISQATGKGQHMTVVSQLFQLPEGGYVADTPGLKALALWDVDPAELDGYFPELRHLVADCQFSDCTHIHEPGCAVRAAVDAGEIHPERYQSYCSLRQGQA
jgi:ribosome biogenesis GTPase